MQLACCGLWPTQVFCSGEDFVGRLSPDLLLTRSFAHCIGRRNLEWFTLNECSTSRPPAYLKNLLINLGRLDWRRRNGKLRTVAF